jgi:hypothetical protein
MIQPGFRRKPATGPKVADGRHAERISGIIKTFNTHVDE